MKIKTALLPEVTVSRLRRLRDVIDLNPPYQREGGVWRSETRSTLIDSMINGLDLPKLYFEKETTRREGPAGLAYQYSVIDGKQRLEAVLAFLAGELALAEDFVFFEDVNVKAAGMNLRQLQQSYPILANRFLDYELPIVSVTSDSGDLIEEMFQRLNASSALNAAERRNALTGPTRDAANMLAEHELLRICSPIRSARYKYRELGAKFLAIEQQLASRGKLTDTKADTLHRLFLATRGSSPLISAAEMEGYRARASATLQHMRPIFVEKDPLLASIGTVVVYYMAFRDTGNAMHISRPKLIDFEILRRESSRMAENFPDYGRPANARLREYNIFVQSTNDGRALSRRAAILTAFVRGFDENDSLAGLDSVGESDPPDFEDPSI